VEWKIQKRPGLELKIILFDLSVSFGVSLLFGSIFSVIAVAGYGLGSGLALSLIASISSVIS
jgi:hypothetical protein